MFDWLRRYMAKSTLTDEVRLLRGELASLRQEMNLANSSLALMVTVSRELTRIADALAPEEPKVVGIGVTENPPQERTHEPKGK